jgi:hypothetical protein
MRYKSAKTLFREKILLHESDLGMCAGTELVAATSPTIACFSGAGS